MLQHEAARRALDGAVERDGAAQDRRDLGGARKLAGQGGGAERMRAATFGAALGLVDHRDHLLVGVAGIVVESEGAVLEQDHAGARRRRGEHLLAGLRQREARHHVGHDERVGEQFADDVLAVRLVGERDDGVGVGVVDVFERQARVQDRLDRRRRRGGVDQQPALLAHHVLVAEGFEPGQRLQRFKLDGGQARRLDGRHVPAAALDAERRRCAAPSRSRHCVLTEVLPPPCSTSAGTWPSSRVV